MIEHRMIEQPQAAVKLETRENGPARIVGYAAVFFDGTDATQRAVMPRLAPNLRERIMSGAFDAALSGDADVRALFNHDRSLILGRRSAGTVQLSVDSVGLRYAILPADTTVARDVAAHIGRGDVTGSSFGFIPREERFIKDGALEVRELVGLELIDVGPVTFPAFEATTAEVRSGGEIEGVMAAYVAWKDGCRAERVGRISRRARCVEIAQSLQDFPKAVDKAESVA